MKGRIKFYLEKGYGFIIPEGETEDVNVFFHGTDVKLSRSGRTQLPHDFQPGDSVEFFVDTDTKGRSKAVEIALMEKATRAPAKPNRSYDRIPQGDTDFLLDLVSDVDLESDEEARVNKIVDAVRSQRGQLQGRPNPVAAHSLAR